LCWQIHRGLTVSVQLLRMWVHCPRASNGLLPRRSNLVGYVRWDAQSDRFPPCQTIIPTAFRSQSGLPVRTQEEFRNSPELFRNLAFSVWNLRLPQFDRIPLRVMQASEPAVGIRLWVNLDSDSRSL